MRVEYGRHDECGCRRVECRGSHYYQCPFFVSGMEATPASARPRADARLNAAQHPDQKTNNSIVFSQDIQSWTIVLYLVKTHEIGHVNANNRLRAVPSVFDDVSIQNNNRTDL